MSRPLRTPRTLLAPIGLPGAGKTTFYKSLRPNIKRIDMDMYKGNLKTVLKEVLNSKENEGDLYLDGLFLTKETQDILILNNVKFIFFNTPKTVCLDNDTNRSRTTKCTWIIQNIKPNKPSRNIIMEI
ncbi:MAG: hypothetical protein J7L15_04850 [Clostridiales bacterium]|nr:hypothetical protein [Clostridiales bacterium]